MTGTEARSALVQALTANGVSATDAAKYQAYIDAGVVIVSLGVAGGQAVYRFTVNGTKVNAADRTVLAALEQKGAANPLGNTRGADDLLPNSSTRVLTETEARGLTGENKGLIYVAESQKGPTAAQEFQAGTTGAFSDVALKKGAVPALRYTNPNTNGVNFVKFDGIEKAADGTTILLIDAKTKLATFNAGAERDVLKTLERVEAALKQNPGYKVVYEFPNDKIAEQASLFIRKTGYNGIVSVRARAQ